MKIKFKLNVQKRENIQVSIYLLELITKYRVLGKLGKNLIFLQKRRM